MIAEIRSRIQVSVFDGRDFVETRSCHRTTTPDGRPAAIYRGLAHPIVDGGRIDLSHSGFVPGGNPPPSLPAERTAVVRGETSGYALIGGSVVEREAAVSALRAAGASVQRSGRYFGDAQNSLSPDWFVRFDLGEATFEAIEAALLGVENATYDDTATSDALRVRLLENELARLRLRAAALDAEVGRLRLERAEWPFSGNADAEKLVRLESERTALQDALTAESQARKAAEDRADRTVARATREFAPRALTTEISTMLGAFVPRVRLVGESLAFLAVEVRDRRHIYRALAQLEATSGGWPPGWKKLREAGGWWERHVADGASDAGRLYARVDQEDRSVEVLISTKGDQSRDLARLRRR